MSWIRFSKFTRISSQEQYFSRVWYSCSSAKAKELHEMYPASSTILLKGDPDWADPWLVNDNPEVVEVEEVVEEEAVVETVPSAEEAWDEDAALEALVETEIMEEDKADEQDDEESSGAKESEEVEE